MNSRNEVFDRTYREYLGSLAELDLVQVAAKLGLGFSGSELRITLLGEDYLVSAAGIFDHRGRRAGFEVCIPIFKYLLMCPAEIPEAGIWTAYHSFKDAQPLLHYFAREVTGPIARSYSGRIAGLRKAGEVLGGRPSTEAGAFDISLQFQLLPRIPLMLRFNDADDEFPAQCTVLFRESVERYLDMESLGILAALFAGKLTGYGSLSE